MPEYDDPNETHNQDSELAYDQIASQDVLKLVEIDLLKSGLDQNDMKTRPMDVAEKAVCGLAPMVDGYVIPYFDMYGKHIPFYRVKLFNHQPKYKQIKNTPNHVYFPPNFYECYTDQNKKYILITEGEKKAALCCKLGIPAVAFGGVDSWRNRTILLPKGTEFGAYSYSKELIGAKLPPQTIGLSEEAFSVLATGLEELIDVARENNSQIVICYDTDLDTGVKPEVQRASANLGFEFTYKGLNTGQVKQLVLPAIPDMPKTALDDFIMAPNAGEAMFKDLLDRILQKANAFPEYPNIKEFVNNKLQRPKLTRREMQQLSLAITANFDSCGIRMHSPDEGQSYYFEASSGKLMPVHLNSPQKDSIAESDFGKFLYKKYGVAAGPDSRLVQWLGTQFVSEGDLSDVSPHRVVTSKDKDVIRYQISDSEYVKVTKDVNEPLKLVTNGTDGVLFESGCVQPLDFDELNAAFKKEQETYNTLGRVENQWNQVLKTVRLKEHVKNADAHRHLISLLYYCSPWLHRWDGAQLPVELVIGEAGSGKAQPLNTPIRTPDGWKSIGDVLPGDFVTTPRGPSKVVAIHPQGVKPVYEVTFSDGVSTRCCGEHLWNVQSEFHRNSGRPFKTKSLTEILAKPLTMSNKHKPRNYIPVSGYVGKYLNLPVKPYTLGALLGNGSFRDAYTANFTCHPSDVAIVNAMREEGYVLNEITSAKYRYNLIGVKNTVFKELDLWGKTSLEKHIPEIYLESSVEQRIALLQGLLDTDGTASGSIVFNTSSKQLGLDVQKLVLSLGGTCSISLRQAPEKRGYARAYNLAIRLPLNIQPFRLERKLSKLKRRQKPLRSIKKVELVGSEDCVCITLEDPTGLYLTENCIVTHNSTLCELRLNMLTGDPKLRNAPTDLKDWYASIANSGGLHVTDNIQLHDKTLKQRLSDEICRLITEPSPHIEMRKYYTNAELMRVKVDGVFCFTAVSQPFLNVDLLQRAVLIELDKQQASTEGVVYDSDWKTNQIMAFGGRAAWVAHHLFVLHRFLNVVETEWKENYYAKHRLINLEQILIMLAKVFGMDSDWIPSHLVGATESSIEEADWALEGLCAFVKAQISNNRSHTNTDWNAFSASDIAQWAAGNEDYMDCLQITNARRLGRYLQTNKATVSQIAFLKEAYKKSNRSIFSIDLEGRAKAKQGPSS